MCTSCKSESQHGCEMAKTKKRTIRSSLLKMLKPKAKSKNKPYSSGKKKLASGKKKPVGVREALGLSSPEEGIVDNKEELGLLFGYSRSGRWDMVRFILKKYNLVDVSAIVNEIPEGKYYGLVHQAAWWGKVSALKLLQNRGADLMLLTRPNPFKKNSTETVIQIAERRGNTETLAYLRQAIPQAFPKQHKPRRHTVSTRRITSKTTVDRKSDVAPTCCVCLDNKATHIFNPCGHWCVCVECVVQLKKRKHGKCPVCNVKAVGELKVFY